MKKVVVLLVVFSIILGCLPIMSVNAADQLIGSFAAIKYDGSVWMWGYGAPPDWTRQLYPRKVENLTNATYLLNNNMEPEKFVALDADDNVWTWGGNGVAEIYTDIGKVKRLFGNTSSVIAMKEDGTLWTWGDNTGNQLGLGNKTVIGNTIITPRQIPGLTNIKKLYINAHRGYSYSDVFDHCYAITADNTLYGWGGNTYTPKVILENVTVPDFYETPAIDLFHLGYAITADKKLYQLYNDEATLIEGISNVKKPIHFIGQDYSYAMEMTQISNPYFLDEHDTLYAVNYGEAFPLLSDVKSIMRYGTSDDNDIYVLKNNGTVWRLIPPYSSYNLSEEDFIQVTSLQNIKKIINCSGTFFAIDKSGSVWSWGENSYGMLGTGNANTGAVIMDPQKLNLKNIKDVFHYGLTVYALTNDEKVWYWGDIASSTVPVAHTLPSTVNYIYTYEVCRAMGLGQVYNSYMSSYTYYLNDNGTVWDDQLKPLRLGSGEGFMKGIVAFPDMTPAGVEEWCMPVARVSDDLVEITIINTYDNYGDDAPTILLGAYDTNGVLVAVFTDTVREDVEEYQFHLTDYPEAAQIKAFLWKDANNMQSLTGNVSRGI